MLNAHNGGGLVWSPLFNISEKEKDEFKAHLKNNFQNYTLSHFFYDFSNSEITNNDELDAIQYAILKFLITHTSFASDILNEEDYQKACDTFKRGQFNNGVLQSLIVLFLNAHVYFSSSNKENNIKSLLYSDTNTHLVAIKEKRTDKEFAPLKKVIEKVASGVKPECYLNVFRQSYIDRLDENLNNYIIEKYKYNPEYVHSYLKNNSNKLFQLALLNDKNFWNDKDFSVISFINLIAHYNSEKHAQKVIDYIFEELKKDSSINTLIENNLEIGISGLDNLKLFYQNIVLNNGASTELLFPLFDVKDSKEKFENGKVVFESFLYDYVYPHCKDVVKERLSKNIKEGIYYNIFDLLNFNVLGRNITAYENELTALKIFCPDFFKDENLWNRVYLKAHTLSLSVPENKINESLFNCFYNLCEFLNQDLSIETAIQLDTQSRKQGYRMLHNILNSYGVCTSTFKSEDYIAALMDRKSATLKEAERFSVLEQLGDAIYGFAVAEMMFYNPYYDDYENYHKNEINVNKRFESFTKAEAQVEIAKKLRIDKMYISASSVLCKYDYQCLNHCDYEFTFTDKKPPKEKYLADSLEMILGAVCLDKGYKTAINLAKKLVRSTYKDDFPEEVHFTYENYKNFSLEDTFIERDYWIRILPSPFSYLDEENNQFTESYRKIMWESLSKLLLCVLVGTDTKKKREYISNSSYNNELNKLDKKDHWDYGQVSLLFYCYLQSGLDTAIEIYKNDILDAVNKEIKK